MKTLELTAEEIKQGIKSNGINTLKEKQQKLFNAWVTTDLSISKETEDFKSKSISKDTLKWFRNLGGKETVKQGVKFGYGCTISTSISPDGLDKLITYFFY